MAPGHGEGARHQAVGDEGKIAGDSHAAQWQHRPQTKGRQHQSPGQPAEDVRGDHVRFPGVRARCAMAGATRVGAEVTLTDSIRPDALLFGEATGRVIVTSANPEELLARARAAGIPAARIGTTGGTQLRIGPAQGPAWIDASLAELHSIWSRALPRRLEAA